MCVTFSHVSCVCLCSQSSGDLFGRQESDADEDRELKDGEKTDVIETQQVSSATLKH